MFSSAARQASTPRTDSGFALYAQLLEHHPSQHIAVTSTAEHPLQRFASAGYAECTPLPSVQSYAKVSYDALKDQLSTDIVFCGYRFVWNDHHFTIYLTEFQDHQFFCKAEVTYIVSDAESSATDLLSAVGRWSVRAEGEKGIWTFDRTCWKKDRSLYKNVFEEQATDLVISPEIHAVVERDIKGFFQLEERYAKFGVPWKRGIIFHGPPGNGKTLALRHVLRALPQNVQALYVKALTDPGYDSGPFSQSATEALRKVFQRARAAAPCLLIWEDIDSLVSEKLRSYFLNEVDGLESNDGVLLLATTNHLDKLDPAMSNRPGRFDRKVWFSLPEQSQRERYCALWAKRINILHGDEEEMKWVVDNTNGFSFAYLKEMWLAALMGMAQTEGVEENGRSAIFDRLKESIKALKEEMKAAVEASEETKGGGAHEVQPTLPGLGC